MALTREEIQDIFSRVPIISPPPHMFILDNAEIGADRLFNITHSLNAAGRQLDQERLRILGMHRSGESFVTISGDAPESTPIHEAIHAMGLKSEPATYALTRALLARSRFNLGFRRRPVKYAEVPVDSEQRDSFLVSMHLSNPSGEPVRLVHLRYEP